jgi:uncharacterized RDD family membrane protein YckC
VTPRRLGPLERLPQAVAEQVVKRIVEVIDIDEIVRRVDVNDVVERVDVNAVMERVDVNRLVDEIDIDRIVARIDVNAIADRIDIDELVKRANLGPIIAQSTSGMAGEFLGFLRREVVSLDGLLDSITFFRRRTADKPTGPPALANEAPKTTIPNREGQYAGGITRLLAIAVDLLAVWGIFLLLSAGFDAAVRLVSGHTYEIQNHRTVGLVAVIVFGFLYFALQWNLSGRTIGMAILGAHVVTTEGHSITFRQSAIRTIVLPFAIVFWFVGLIEIVIRADRRALHDLCAGTCVVYHWQARGASLPWLQRDD